jgi:hypothetical protein
MYMQPAPRLVGQRLCSKIGSKAKQLGGTANNGKQLRMVGSGF